MFFSLQTVHIKNLRGATPVQVDADSCVHSQIHDLSAGDVSLFFANFAKRKKKIFHSAIQTRDVSSRFTW